MTKPTFDPSANGLWEVNGDGAWCPACGDMIASDFHLFQLMDDPDWEPPTTCRECGYPDFEDGPGYFTGEE